MRIPFFQPSIGDREVEAAVAVLQSGWLTTGRKCREFEERFADLLGGGVETVAVNSATAGIHLAAEACGIGLGDGVLVPTLTFSATAAAFHHLGADIILVDVDPISLTIDLDDADRKWTPQCKAIAPVHFGGWPCDVEAIAEVRPAARPQSGRGRGARSPGAQESSAWSALRTRMRASSASTPTRRSPRARAE